MLSGGRFESVGRFLVGTLANVTLCRSKRGRRRGYRSCFAALCADPRHGRRRLLSLGSRCHRKRSLSLQCRRWPAGVRAACMRPRAAVVCRCSRGIWCVPRASSHATFCLSSRQRFCTQHQVKLGKLESIFLTELNADTLGGASLIFSCAFCAGLLPTCCVCLPGPLPPSPWVSQRGTSSFLSTHLNPKPSSLDPNLPLQAPYPP
jgi:hypothetical protein